MYYTYLNSIGESQLQQLVKDPGHTDEEIELLINEGSNVNHADKSGYRPLHDAALSNCSNYVNVSFVFYEFTFRILFYQSPRLSKVMLYLPISVRYVP